MIVKFKHEFSLPVEEVYSYFQTPADWVRLYGLADDVKDLGAGWHRLRKPESTKKMVSSSV